MVAQPVSQPRAAVYVRVSTDKQGENYSLPTQEARCRAYAAEHGYQVTEVYRETHTASELWQRPELTRLRQAMAHGEVDALIVFDPDRFSRKQVHTALLQGMCEQAGVELLFAEFDFTRDATGQFMLNARVFAAELEREKFMERSMRGKRARVESGRIMPGPRPLYGYRFRDEEKTGYEPDLETAPIVRWIFEQAVSGKPTRGIAAELDRRGVEPPGRDKTRGKIWYQKTVANLLNNEAYTGKAYALRWRYSKVAGGKRPKVERPVEERVPLPEGTIPPIIDEATFEIVQQRLRRNQQAAARNNRNPEAALLRGGYVRCGVCGVAMRVAHRPSRGREMELYVCSRDIRTADCTHPSISAKNLDAEVRAFVAERLTKRERVERHVERMLPRTRPPATLMPSSAQSPRWSASGATWRGGWPSSMTTRARRRSWLS